MMDKVSDEMLMAFVDGELDLPTAESIRRAVCTDPQLAAREAEFRHSANLARLAYGGIRAEAAPEALVAAVRQAARRTMEPSRGALRSPSRWLPARSELMALAAGFVLVLGGGFLAGQATVSPSATGGIGLVGAGPVAEALGQTGSGQVREMALGDGTGRLTTRGTYPVPGGHCRSFELATAERGLIGVGCSRDGPWEVELALASAGETAGYAPASGAALAAVDAYLDSLEAGASLPAGQ